MRMFVYESDRAVWQHSTILSPPHATSGSKQMGQPVAADLAGIVASLNWRQWNCGMSRQDATLLASVHAVLAKIMTSYLSRRRKSLCEKLVDATLL